MQPNDFGMSGFAATHLVIVGVGITAPAVTRFAQLNALELPENCFGAPKATPAYSCLFDIARHSSKPVFMVPTINK